MVLVTVWVRAWVCGRCNGEGEGVWGCYVDTIFCWESFVDKQIDINEYSNIFQYKMMV